MSMARSEHCRLQFRALHTDSGVWQLKGRFSAAAILKIANNVINSMLFSRKVKWNYSITDWFWNDILQNICSRYKNRHTHSPRSRLGHLLLRFKSHLKLIIAAKLFTTAEHTNVEKTTYERYYTRQQKRFSQRIHYISQFTQTQMLIFRVTGLVLQNYSGNKDNSSNHIPQLDVGLLLSQLVHLKRHSILKNSSLYVQHCLSSDCDTVHCAVCVRY